MVTAIKKCHFGGDNTIKSCQTWGLTSEILIKLVKWMTENLLYHRWQSWYMYFEIIFMYVHDFVSMATVIKHTLVKDITDSNWKTYQNLHQSNYKQFQNWMNCIPLSCDIYFARKRHFQQVFFNENFIIQYLS